MSVMDLEQKPVARTSLAKKMAASSQASLMAQADLLKARIAESLGKTYKKPSSSHVIGSRPVVSGMISPSARPIVAKGTPVSARPGTSVPMSQPVTDKPSVIGQQTELEVSNTLVAITPIEAVSQAVQPAPTALATPDMPAKRGRGRPRKVVAADVPAKLEVDPRQRDLLTAEVLQTRVSPVATSPVVPMVTASFEAVPTVKVKKEEVLPVETVSAVVDSSAPTSATESKFVEVAQEVKVKAPEIKLKGLDSLRSGLEMLEKSQRDHLDSELEEKAESQNLAKETSGRNDLDFSQISAGFHLQKEGNTARPQYTTALEGLETRALAQEAEERKNLEQAEASEDKADILDNPLFAFARAVQADEKVDPSAFIPADKLRKEPQAKTGSGHHTLSLNSEKRKSDNIHLDMMRQMAAPATPVEKPLGLTAPTWTKMEMWQGKVKRSFEEPARTEGRVFRVASDEPVKSKQLVAGENDQIEMLKKLLPMVKNMAKDLEERSQRYAQQTEEQEKAVTEAYKRGYEQGKKDLAFVNHNFNEMRRLAVRHMLNDERYEMPLKDVEGFPFRELLSIYYPTLGDLAMASSEELLTVNNMDIKKLNAVITFFDVKKMMNFITLTEFSTSKTTDLTEKSFA